MQSAPGMTLSMENIKDPYIVFYYFCVRIGIFFYNFLVINNMVNHLIYV